MTTATSKKVKKEVERFDGEWASCTLESEFTFLKTASNSRSELNWDETVRYIHYGDIHTKWTHFLDFKSDTVPCISPTKLGTASRLKDGDLVIADASEDMEGVGKCIQIKNLENLHAISGLHTIALRCKTGNLSKTFGGYLCDTPTVKSAMRRLANGLKVYGLSKSALKDIVILLPTLPEQRAIANVLSDVDELIDSLDELIEKKRDMKQGAMQQLLAGKTRLPGFDGEWKIKRLGDISHITMGQSPSSLFYNELGLGLPLIQGNADLKNRKSIQRVWASSYNKICKAHEIILTVRAPVGAIAVASFDSAIGRGVCSIKPHSGNSFLYHQLINLESAWQILEQGSTFTAANSTEVNNFPVQLPNDLDEQTAISSILSDMDAEIEALEKRKAKIVAIKQGMMQELLTGKTRLSKTECA